MHLSLTIYLKLFMPTGGGMNQHQRYSSLQCCTRKPVLLTMWLL